MRGNAVFWRNFLLVALLHAFLLVLLTRWTSAAKKTGPTEIVWFDPGAIGSSSSLPAVPLPVEPDEPDADESKEDEQEPVISTTPPVGEIAIPDHTPGPSPSVSPTPRPEIKPSPTPTAKKALLAKAKAKKAGTQSKKKTAKITVKPSGPSPSAAQSANGGSTGGGGTAKATAAQLASYGKILHDRFYAEWVQPTGLPAGAHYALSVRLRIERDGRISQFTLARSSGNVVVDESVEAAGKRVTQVDPLPRELASAGHYELNVNFELNAE